MTTKEQGRPSASWNLAKEPSNTQGAPADGETGGAGIAHERSGDGALAVYAQLLLSRSDCIEFGDPAEILKSMHGIHVPASRLDDIWEPPLLREVPFGTVSERGQAKGSLEHHLEHVLKSAPRVLVLLAQPGGGKSTICRYLACQGARTVNESTMTAKGLPILVPLRQLRPNAASPEDAIATAAAEFVGDGGTSEDLVRQRLKTAFAEGPRLLFDGLDEVPIRSEAKNAHELTRARVVEMIRTLLALYPKATAIVTCRELDYSEDPNAILSEGAHYAVSGLSPDQIQSAVNKWHAAGCDKWTQLRDKKAINWERQAREVCELIRAEPEIGTLASVPLLLSMLQVVLFSCASSKPRSAGQLTSKAVNFLMLEKPRIGLSETSKTVDGYPVLLRHPMGDNWILDTLRRAARGAHIRFIQGQGAAISINEIHTIASDIVGINSRNYNEAGFIVYSIVKHIIRGNGILVESDARQFVFTHNIFREVLAGQALDMLRVEERVELGRTDGWALPLRYWASWVTEQSNGVGAVVHTATDLHKRASKIRSQVEKIAFELAAAEVVCEACAISDMIGPSPALGELRKITQRNLLKILTKKDISASARIRAGDLLGALGDPRLAAIDKLPALVEVPGGRYIVGREQPHKINNPKYEECPAYPQISGELEGFRIGLFPVTNRDFAIFVNEGGYSNVEYWETTDGRAWADQDQKTLQFLEEIVDRTSLKHFVTEVSSGRVGQNELVELRKRILRRRSPLCWFDPRFNRPNQPVVGVNWWEALAYCRWLDHHLHVLGILSDAHMVTLPSEVQWECAGKGPAHTGPYPWGADPPTENAHIRESAGFARTCAVGIFPWARYPAGPLDMVGNVWEWTISAPGKMKAADFTERPSISGMGDRVVRGGSWLSKEPESACLTFRSFDPPCNAYEDLGFRIAVTSKSGVK